MPKTKKPTGLSIARNANKFTFSWKCGDKNYTDGQTLQYKLGSGKWTAVSIGASTRSKVVTVDTSKAFGSVAFRVRGNRAKYTQGKGKKKKKINPTVSDWATKTFDLDPPKGASITATMDEELSNVCKFSWSVARNATDKFLFRYAKYESVLVKNSNVTDGSKITFNKNKRGWKTGTWDPDVSSGSTTITEDTAIFTDTSVAYTRWYRVNAWGPAGWSGWKYSKHVYSQPFTAQINKVQCEENQSGGYNVSVNWTADADASHPIDSSVLQYLIGVPLPGMIPPSGWEDALVIKDTGGQDGAAFTVDGRLQDDECLWVRINSSHDGKTTEGIPALAKAGNLATPSNLSVVTDDTEFTATVSAENESDVTDSFLVVVYRTGTDTEGITVGIIPQGESSVIVQCPDWTGETAKAFGVYACVGSYELMESADDVNTYAITDIMRSPTLWDGGAVPSAPANVAVSATDILGTIKVIWDWAWSDANSAELSWADHPDAWESTDEPSTYRISRMHQPQWNISGLETGITWYVRVRLISTIGDNETLGPWSDIASIDLSSAPSIPVLALSEAVVTEDATFTASWGYSTTDGTMQVYAEIAEVTDGDSNEKVYTPIAHTQSAQHITLNVSDLEWNAGETHLLAVRVTSESGRMSDDWSNPASIVVAEPLECTITATSLELITITEDGQQRVIVALTEMPLSVTAEGAGDGGITTVTIERADAYHVIRPDETEFNGYEGELIATFTQTGEDEITFTNEDLIGALDDEAPYRLIATVQDGLGQSATSIIEFEVHWTHQAIMPEATAEVDNDKLVAFITPIAPSGAGQGDTCDIYRLSVDRPQLIYKDAEFGTKYVDPYPAIGEYGGHRVVYKTVNGDYITANYELAWLDLTEDEGDLIESEFNIIEFGTGRVQLRYNIDVNNAWSKDFIETQYLGGGVQGDWNPAVSRTASVNAMVMADDEITISSMRRLATYSGICHVRTKDGSSYAADVQVAEDYANDSAHKVAQFTLTITRVDTPEQDGMTYAEWSEIQGEDE